LDSGTAFLGNGTAFADGVPAFLGSGTAFSDGGMALGDDVPSFWDVYLRVESHLTVGQTEPEAIPTISKAAAGDSTPSVPGGTPRRDYQNSILVAEQHPGPYNLGGSLVAKVLSTHVSYASNTGYQEIFIDRLKHGTIKSTNTTI
jgi:hypothetical protein